MLRSCFFYFAVEHWFGCRVTVPGLAGDIGAVVILLTDVWIESACHNSLKNFAKETEIKHWPIIFMLPLSSTSVCFSREGKREQSLIKKGRILQKVTRLLLMLLVYIKLEANIDKGPCNVLGHMLLYLQISTMLGWSGRKRQMAVVLAPCKTAPFNL